MIDDDIRPDDVWLTADDVRHWREEKAQNQRAIEQHEAEIERLRANNASIDQRLAAVAVIRGEPTPVEETALGAGNGLDLTMTLPAMILAITRLSPEGLSKLEIRQRLINAGVEQERLGPNFAAFYTAVGRLERKGKLEKHGEKYRVRSMT